MNQTTREILHGFEKKVKSYVPKPMYRDDAYVKIAIIEAINAAMKGNFGVGALLVDNDGKIIVRGHNHVFSPYFRSDLHAEMDVMNKFEKRYKNAKNVKTLTLYTSLEPCPMCFARLMTSGVRTIYYAAKDIEGGMVHKLKDMPKVWIDIARRQEFALARCSSELRIISMKVFETTVVENNDKLMNH